MQKGHFTPQQLREMSSVIMRRLTVHPKIKNSSTIMMYYSLDDEVFTHEVIDQLVSEGKKILLPAVISDTEMELRCYEGPQDLVGGFFHIMEPIGKKFSDYAQIEVAVVPGMGFDSRCNRLGRGKGYYDRFLPLLPNAYKLGVCFDFQKMPGIPADTNDIKVDEVI